MANIRIDLDHAPRDGETISFKAPCNASSINGLVIYYADGDGTVSKPFTLTDANGGDIGVLDNIFAKDAIVKAVLDTNGNKAFVQNADTNTYLEAQLASKAPSSHVSNKNNPHGVTKSQVGLGNVPNVATNDQTPTFTVASTMATLTSGEKLSVAFGKIAKAITDLISHIGNKSNPHGVTKAQVGLGNVDNTSDANKPVSTAQATAIADAKSAGTTAQSNLNSHASNKSNPHGVTAAQIGAAPDGYGLGKTPPSVLTDANAVTAAQFFRTTSSTSNLSAATRGVGISIPYSTSEGVQLMVRTNNGAIRVRRTENGTTWYEEYVNPVMTAGTEYATVERSAGKTVYTKRIDYTFDSAIGNTDGLTDYTIDPGIPDFKALVRCVCTDGVYILPYTSSDGGSITVKTVVGNEITLRTYKASLPARTLSFYLYYTKNA